METTEHLFPLCKWTKTIWADPRINIISNPSNIKRFDQWLMEAFEEKEGLPRTRTRCGGAVEHMEVPKQPYF